MYKDSEKNYHPAEREVLALLQLIKVAHMLSCGENNPRLHEVLNIGVGLHVRIVIWSRSQLRRTFVTMSFESQKSR